MPKVVRKRKKKEQKPDRGRNEGKSEVYGISASRKFWEVVTQKMAEQGTNRSETIVAACAAAWEDNTIHSNPVGRPRENSNE